MSLLVIYTISISLLKHSSYQDVNQLNTAIKLLRKSLGSVARSQSSGNNIGVKMLTSTVGCTFLYLLFCEK